MIDGHGDDVHTQGVGGGDQAETAAAIFQDRAAVPVLHAKPGGHKSKDANRPGLAWTLDPIPAA